MSVLILLSKIVFLAGFLYLLWTRSRTLLAYFQQEEYDATRFPDAILSVRLYDIRASLAIVASLLLIGTWAPIAGILLAAALIALIAWREGTYRFKKPLAMTERARRILWLARGLAGVAALSVLCSPWWALVVIQMLPLALVLANLVLAPMQQKINQGFIDEATAKLARMQPVTIGITGSFGKTTVKHILAELLEVSGPVFYSRGSINTVLGLTRHIRQRLQFSHRYFIAEMGAYGIGSIKRLCDFAHPEYGIITAVGHAHAERFGSLENTAKAKSELAAHVCAHGKGVVVTEAVAALEPFAKLREAHPGKFTVVGESETSDVQIVEAVLVGALWRITLRFNAQDGQPELTFDLPLLGAHNIMNAALAVAMVALVDPEAVARLPLATPEVSQIPHRLQKKAALAGPLILDDAYNSNETGFGNAVSVLRNVADEQGGKAILVTPGVAELGDQHSVVHERLGKLSGEACDLVVIVNPYRIPTFQRAAEGQRAEIVTKATLNEAQAYVRGLSLGAQDVVLYENDLPDVLEEKRIL
ncbi:Mur ligase family protein [Pseudooceanicola nanhaiensis]|uniref:Mur ligase family protein n=1 Tax=Pseudooceanicola nanhaiensis TaxID=375761 RepID=UPI001CD752E9|nr:Mur ligase family protein [Pseudooceanicola nanhaiensis]MCA0920705.1 hypothetical protein [Pseudooceanicola nanhaiensis]